MSMIGIIFLIISFIFFVLGILMFIIQKIITSRIYLEGQKEIKEEKKTNKSISKLNVEDIDTSLLDEIEDDEKEEL